MSAVERTAAESRTAPYETLLSKSDQANKLNDSISKAHSDMVFIKDRVAKLVVQMNYLRQAVETAMPNSKGKGTTDVPKERLVEQMVKAKNNISKFRYLIDEVAAKTQQAGDGDGAGGLRGKEKVDDPKQSLLSQLWALRTTYPSLYIDRLSKVYEKAVRDPRTRAHFEKNQKKMDSIKAKMCSFVTGLFGGPKTYDEENIQPVHYHMNITDYHFDAVLEMFQQVFNELDIHPNAITDGLAELGRCRKLITTGCTVRMEVAKKNEEMGTDMMFVKVGYGEGLEDFIKRLFDLSKVDRRLKKFFQGEEPPVAWYDFVDCKQAETYTRIRTALRAYLTERFGGPKEYKGRELEEIHRGLGLDDFYFDCFLMNAEKALHGLGVDEDIIAEVLITLEFARPNVLNRKRDQLSQFKLVDGATIFERIGGDMNLEAVVETMYSGALLDPRIKFFFDLPKDRVEQIKERMCTFLSMITGAPEVHFDVKALKEMHRGINITDYHFDALMENMKVACELMEIEKTAKVDFLECVSHVRGIITAGCTVRLELAKRRTEIGVPSRSCLFGRNWRVSSNSLGESKGIAKAVERLYEQVDKDERLSPFLSGAKLGAIARAQTKFLTHLFGGAEEYKGRDLKRIHQMIDIYDYHMDAFVNLMKTVLEEADQDPETIDSCVILMETCRSQIVKPADHDVRRAQAMANKKPLYERLGGEMSIAKLSDIFYAEAMEDSRTRSFFEKNKAKIATIKKKITQLIGTVTGGSKQYDLADLKPSHYSMNITDFHFDAVICLIRQAGEALHISSADLDELLSILQKLRPEITTGCTVRREMARQNLARSEEGEGLYERLFESEGITRLMDSLFHLIAKDNRIKDFFPADSIQFIKEATIVFFVELFGGPPEYEGRDLTDIHEPLGITDYHFDAFLSNMSRALLSQGHEDSLVDEVIITLDSVRNAVLDRQSEIVIEPRNGLNLLERIGGDSNLEAVAEGMFQYFTEDSRIKFHFDKNKAKERSITTKLYQFLSGAFGGLVQYDQDNLKPIHYDMNISDYHFDAVLECFVKSAEELEEIDEDVIPDSLRILNSVRSEIITGSRVRMDAAERRNNEDGVDELFRRIGKVQGVEKFVDQLYECVERDKRIHMFFEGAKLQAIKKAQTDYFIGLFGGPSEYKGRSLEEVHEIVAMTDYHLDCFFLNIQKCLRMIGFNNETIDQFVVLMEKLRPQILHHHYKRMRME
ncbi:hypothetical protein FOZ60_015921 [Perkinsus olseni]|uniref:Uncharacterized protein n=1 Tax=Perkinsus olseni TaxID=32597 RepID=A0A7J6P542_PEROL|nr:hypothetical protein FOZ60_015921 [Perkinsus olseni]